jgi:type II secretory pathway component PulF
MPQFVYKARRRSGELVQGGLEVADRSAALAQIERLGMFPISVEAPKGSAAAKLMEKSVSSKEMKAGFLPPALREFLDRPRKPKLQELATYTQQLANLLHAGMPLAAALNSMTHLGTKGIPTTVSKQLKQDVMEGKSLSDAMARQPIIFSNLYVNMVRAGEQSGAMVEVLRRLADHFERYAEVQSKFISAMIYPVIVACVGVVIVFFFMTVMLPNFMDLFVSMNVQLPPATRMLIGLSHFFTRYWWFMILVTVAAIVVFKRYQSTPTGRKALDRLKLSAPIVGKVVRLNVFAQFARTLATLMHNGVPVLTSLSITEQIMSNVIVKEAIAKTRSDVTDGKSLAQPLASTGVFPQLMIDLVRIGEETGQVPSALNRIAETYDGELTVALRVMTNLIEPALIIVMALGVGFLLFSVLSAMFAITSSINRS